MKRTRSWLHVATVTLAVLTLGMMAFGFYRSLPALIPDPVPFDFTAYYVGAAILNEGDADALYDTEVQATVGSQNGLARTAEYIYLPVLAIVLRPLATLPFDQAVDAWLLINLLLLYASALFLLRLARLRVSPVRSILAFAVCLILPPVTTTLTFGQVNIVILFFLAAAVYMLDGPEVGRNRGVTAGLMLGLAMAIKLFPAFLVVPLLFRRRWSAIFGIATGILVALLAGIAGAGGISNTARYFTKVLPAISSSVLPYDQSLLTVVQRFLVPFEYSFSVFSSDNFTTVRTTPWINAPYLVGPTYLILMGLALFLTFRGLFHLSRNHAPPGVDLALCLAAILILLPHVWDHYHALLALPLAVLLSTRARHSGAAHIAIWAVFLLALQRYSRVIAAAGVPVQLLSFGFLSVAIIWLYLAYVAITGSSQGEPVAHNSPVEDVTRPRATHKPLAS